MKQNVIITLILRLILVVFTFLPCLTFAVSGITYHGKIVQPDGNPLVSSTAQFRMQIRTPGTENCLLWEESRNYDLSSSNGVFTITIADSTAPSYLRMDSYSWGLDRVFSNRTNFTALTNCSVGTVYNPSPSDGRTLQVYFRDAPTSTWEAIPLTKINFVPIALNSVQLEGYQASEFLKIDPASTYTTLTPANVNSLMNLISGASTVYIKPADALGGDLTGTHAAAVVDGIQGVGVAATAPTLNQVLKYNGTAWAPAADDAGATGDASYAAKGIVQFDTNLATSGINVVAGVASLPNTITAGGPTGNTNTIPVITYDAKGRLTAVTTATVNDNTKLPLAGGTMTGAIDMGNQNIANVNSVSTTGVGTRTLTIYDADNSNYATLQVPSVLTANYALTLPADDGTSGQVLSTDGAGVLSWVANGAGGISVTANQAVVANGTGTGLVSFTCGLNQVMGFDGAGLPQCQNVTAAGGFLNGGNSFGAAATLGTNDNFDLNIETNGTNKMTIKNDGKVGIGTTSPAGNLVVRAAIGEMGYVGLEYANFGHSLGQDTYNGGTSSVLEFGGGNPTVGGGIITGYGNAAAGLKLRGAVSSTTATSAPMVLSGVKWNSASDGANVGDSEPMIQFEKYDSTIVTTITGSGNLGLGLTSPNTQIDMTGALTQRGMAAPALSPAGQGRIYFDSTSNTFKVSQNGGAYTDLVSGGSSQWVTSGSDIYYDTGKVAIGTPTIDTGANLTTTSTGSHWSFSLPNTSGGGIPWYIGSSGGGWSSGGGKFLISRNTAASSSDFVIDNSGKFGIGILNPQNKLEVGGATIIHRTPASETAPHIVVEHTFGDSYSGTVNAFNTGGDTTAPYHAAVYGNATNNQMYGMIVATSHSSAWTATTGALSTGKYLAGIGFAGQTGASNGTQTTMGASIIGQVEGTVSSGVLPSALVFNTSLTNSVGLTERMRITSNGNVGIGTTAPNTILDINGALSQRGMAAPALSPAGQGRIYFDSTSNSFKVSQNGGAYVDLVPAGGTGDILNGGNTTGAAVTIGTNDNFGLNFETNGATRLSIANSGNVSVGTTGMNSAFSVRGDSMLLRTSTDSTGQVELKFLEGEAGLGSGVHLNYVANDNELRFDAYTNSVYDRTVMTVERNGNVGFGTNTPQSKIDVSGDVMVSAGQAFKFGPNGSAAIAGDGYNIGTDHIDFITEYTEKMRIASNGNVGIGTNSPSRKLHIAANGGGTVSNMLLLDETAGGDGAGASILFRAAGGNQAEIKGFWESAGQNTLAINVGASERMRINNAGNVGIGTTSPSNPLDVRNSSTTVAPIKAVNSGNTAYLPLMDLLAPNIGIGNWVSFQLGKSASNYNSANMSFYHANDGSTSNAIYFNLYGLSPALSILGTGNVGIGTTSPTNKLEVSGNTRVVAGQISAAAYNAAAATSFDFNNGNTQYTTAACQAMTLSNIQDGGSYSVGVKNTSGTCSFTHAGLTVRYVGGVSNVTITAHTIFTFLRMGSDLYVSWVSF